MFSDQCLLLFLLQSTSSFIFTRKTKILTYPCNVIGEFSIVQKVRQIGDTSWDNVCPDGRYIQSVWSTNPKEPFLKAKCCGTHVDTSFSWEIRDVSFHGDGSSDVDKDWNIECDKYSVMTGKSTKCLFVPQCSHEWLSFESFQISSFFTSFPYELVSILETSSGNNP